MISITISADGLVSRVRNMLSRLKNDVAEMESLDKDLREDIRASFSKNTYGTPNLMEDDLARTLQLRNIGRRGAPLSATPTAVPPPEKSWKSNIVNHQDNITIPLVPKSLVDKITKNGAAPFVFYEANRKQIVEAYGKYVMEGVR
jgi:hypothetical protein